MISHHSIATLASERADIEDPRVRGPAYQIIKPQREEIAEMDRLVQDQDIQATGSPDRQDAEVRPVPTFSAAL